MSNDALNVLQEMDLDRKTFNELKYRIQACPYQDYEDCPVFKTGDHTCLSSKCEIKLNEIGGGF